MKDFEWADLAESILNEDEIPIETESPTEIVDPVMESIEQNLSIDIPKYKTQTPRQKLPQPGDRLDNIEVGQDEVDALLEFVNLEDKIEESSPPGMEDVVHKLKKEYGYETDGQKAKVHATAWKIYNSKTDNSKAQTNEGSGGVRHLARKIKAKEKDLNTGVHKMDSYLDKSKKTHVMRGRQKFKKDEGVKRALVGAAMSDASKGNTKVADYHLKAASRAKERNEFKTSLRKVSEEWKEKFAKVKKSLVHPDGKVKYAEWDRTKTTKLKDLVKPKMSTKKVSEGSFGAKKLLRTKDSLNKARKRAAKNYDIEGHAKIQDKQSNLRNKIAYKIVDMGVRKSLKGLMSNEGSMSLAHLKRKSEAEKKVGLESPATKGRKNQKIKTSNQRALHKLRDKGFKRPASAKDLHNTARKLSMENKRLEWDELVNIGLDLLKEDRLETRSGEVTIDEMTACGMLGVNMSPEKAKKTIRKLKPQVEETVSESEEEDIEDTEEETVEENLSFLEKARLIAESFKKDTDDA